MRKCQSFRYAPALLFITRATIERLLCATTKQYWSEVKERDVTSATLVLGSSGAFADWFRGFPHSAVVLSIFQASEPPTMLFHQRSEF